MKVRTKFMLSILVIALALASSGLLAIRFSGKMSLRTSPDLKARLERHWILTASSVATVFIGCMLTLAILQTRSSRSLDLAKTDESILMRELDQTRSSLIEAQEQLLESERLAAIGRMASFVSHDLRHMLTAVVGNAEFLATQDLSAAQRRDFYKHIDNGVRRMTDLLESLVAFSRAPESLELQFVSIRQVLLNALLTIRTQPRFQNIMIAVVCDETVQGWFDAKKVELAVFNLLLNACRAVPEDSGRVEVHAARNDTSIDIRVIDNGPGVPESIRQKVFEPFVSAGKQSGSGLGLAIVQKCCTDHGGKAFLENSRPGATTFHMALRVREDPDSTL